MKMLIMGAPGSGKGTQSEILVNKLGIPTISTGAMLRAAIAEGTEVGKEASKYINDGKLVPDSVMIDLVLDRISKDDCKNGYILDGFPRTPEQLKAFVDQKIANIDVVVDLEVPYERLLERVTGRRTCKSCGYIYNTSWNLGYETCPKCGGEWGIRSDDNEETYKTRYDVYLSETLPILDYFKKEGKVIVVEGQSEPEESYQNMIDAFNASNIKGLKEFIKG